jgi:hypothetical protein
MAEPTECYVGLHQTELPHGVYRARREEVIKKPGRFREDLLQIDGSRQQVDIHFGIGLSAAAIDHFIGIGYSFRFQALRR